MLVLYTDGGDSTSRMTFGQLTDLLRLGNVLVYVMGYLENQSSSQRAPQQMRMNQLARETEAKVPNEDLETLANALQEVGIAELALAVRQVLIGREKGYDDQDRRNIAAALKSLAPAAAEPVVARLAAKKPEFIRVILP